MDLHMEHYRVEKINVSPLNEALVVRIGKCLRKLIDIRDKYDNLLKSLH